MSHEPIRVGEFEVTVVCEGWAPLELEDECPGRGVDWDAELDRAAWAFAGDGDWRWHVHAFVLRTPTSTIVVDSGAGSFGQIVPWAEEHGPAAWSGLDLAAVDHVVLTHLHADHAGGTVVEGGEPRFPNATYHAHPEDWRYFAERPDGSGYDARAAMAGLQARGRVDLGPEDREVAPGVRVVHSPGHTPGHRSVVAGEGADRLLLTGDLLHLPIQVRHPDWPSSHDVDAEVACRSRSTLLTEANAEGWRVAVSHFARPFGHVDRDADDGLDWRSG
jgi:glyoxylase-like metal-dependent hydrolase (beta-lactamase superfamily II)